MSGAKKYIEDGYRREFEAEIDEAAPTDRGWEVTLAGGSYFYPESGGQPADRGSIGGIRVLDVRLDGERVVHLLESEPAAARGPLRAVIDWERRFDHMQQHTGQHLLTAAFIELYDADTVGFHLGEAASTIDITLPALSPEKQQRAEELCGEWIAAALPVVTEIVSIEDYRAMDLRKKALPEGAAGPVRLVRIGEVDVAHCGGTHVRSASELQLVKIIGTERVRDTCRVSFLAGRRALRDYAAKHKMLGEMAAALTCAVEDLPQTVEKARVEAGENHRLLKKARRELIEYRAGEELAVAMEVGDRLLLIRRYEGWGADELKKMAGKLTSDEPRLVCCLAGNEADKAVVVLAAGECFTGDLGETVGRLLPHFGGRGGGRGRFAQAAGAPAKLGAFMAEAESLLRELEG